MAEGIITLPDGRRARITGPDRETVERKARELVQQPATEQRPSIGQAFGRAAVDSFVNNILGIPDLAVTSLLNMPSPRQLIQSDVVQAMEAGEPQPQATLVGDVTGRQPPAIGARVLPTPESEDFRAAGDVLSQMPGAVSEGESPDILGRFRQARELRGDETQRFAEERPGATLAGSVAGDAATLVAGRAPFARGATRRGIVPQAARKPTTQMEPGIRRALDRTFRSNPVKSLASRAGRSAETGLEASVLQLLNEGDPLEVAAYAAGGQAAGSLMLGLTTTRKGLIGLAATAAGYATLIQMGKTSVPGGRNFILESGEAGIEKVKWGIMLGAMSGLAGAGRVRGGRMAQDMPIIADSISAMPRGAAISLIREFVDRGEPETMETVLQQVAEDPERYTPSQRRRIERALNSEKISFAETVDSLMEQADFRRRFFGEDDRDTPPF